MNQLKEVNDRFGHEKGNIALQTLCRAVCRLYKHSPVYRIGGDEFVVILEGEDYDNRDALFQKVQAFERIRDLKASQPWTQLAASVEKALGSTVVKAENSVFSCWVCVTIKEKTGRQEEGECYGCR